jgi:hypothetical protein
MVFQQGGGNGYGTFLLLIVFTFFAAGVSAEAVDGRLDQGERPEGGPSDVVSAEESQEERVSQWKEQVAVSAELVSAGHGRYNVTLREEGFAARFGSIAADWNETPGFFTDYSVNGMDTFAWVESNGFAESRSFDSRIRLPETYETVYRCEGSRPDPRCEPIPKRSNTDKRPFYVEKDGTTFVYAAGFSGAAGDTNNTEVFDTVGETTWNVPAGVKEVNITAWGADGTGGGSSGGIGGRAKAKFSVSPGDTLHISVGGQGGGGSGGSTTNAVGGDGGAMSNVSHKTDSRTTMLVVGGGGGGGGDESATTDSAGGGGDGGPNKGQNGTDASTSVTSATGGEGGSQTAAGSGGSPGGNAGSGEDGGSGGTASGGGGSREAAGGGGGDGWYGGGGGGAETGVDGGVDYASGAGGGGGSNFVNSSWEKLWANESGVGASNGGNGKVKIEYQDPVVIWSNETYNSSDYDNIVRAENLARSDDLTIRSNITSVTDSVVEVNVTIRNTTGQVVNGDGNESMTNISAQTIGGQGGGLFEYNLTDLSGADVGEWSFRIWARDPNIRRTINDTFNMYVSAILNITYSNNTDVNLTRFDTFNVTANVTCTGKGTYASDANCGSVEGNVLYASFDNTPSTTVSTTTGDTPLFASGANPATCEGGDLLDGETCSLNWTVNASVRETNNVGVNFSGAEWMEYNVTGSKKVAVEPLLFGSPFTFTSCGAAGRVGPSQSDCDTAYSDTALEGAVNVTGNGTQEWDMPFPSLYRITAYGAEAGNGSNGKAGRGAVMRGIFDLSGQINLIVGQQGEGNGSYENAGGGGGSFVWDPDDTTEPFIVAGGGGAPGDEGQPSCSDGVAGDDASTNTSGTDSGCGNYQGGTGGDGGDSGGSGAGAGWKGNGSGGSLGGVKPLESGLGGNQTDASGGFGGGGADGSSPEGGGSDGPVLVDDDSEGGGGGGGYSGGAASDGSDDAAGGGGGSFISDAATEMASSDGTYNGSDVTNLSVWNRGGGTVVIESFSDVVDPSPAEGEVDVRRENGAVNLSVRLNDETLFDRNISFHNASDNSFIKRVGDIGVGERRQVTWKGLENGTDYEWYTNTTRLRDEKRRRNPTYTFRTMYDRNYLNTTDPQVSSWPVRDNESVVLFGKQQLNLSLFVWRNADNPTDTVWAEIEQPNGEKRNITLRNTTRTNKSQTYHRSIDVKDYLDVTNDTYTVRFHANSTLEGGTVIREQEVHTERFELKERSSSDSSFNFTTCGALGTSGPSQSDCDSEYSGTNLEGEVNVIDSGIQEFTIPAGVYEITAEGAEGGGTGGRGAVVDADFEFKGGETLRILVGQAGACCSNNAGGGGGGSFVVEAVDSGDTMFDGEEVTPLIIAGAGGGSGEAGGGDDAVTDTWGTSSGTNDGGTGGNGGETSSDDQDGGAGYFTNSSDNEAFLDGGLGNACCETGTKSGFGGGGNSDDDKCCKTGGGGAGYSGGGAGADGTNESGGGGGSFVNDSGSSLATSDGNYNGTVVENLGRWRTGNGSVFLELLGEVKEPIPEDDATDVIRRSRDVNITVKLLDSIFPRNMTFYNAADDSEIGSLLHVGPGERGEVRWQDRAEATEYEWYVNTTYKGNEVSSGTFRFTTRLDVNISFRMENKSQETFQSTSVTFLHNDNNEEWSATLDAETPRLSGLLEQNGDYNITMKALVNGSFFRSEIQFLNTTQEVERVHQLVENYTGDVPKDVTYVGEVYDFNDTGLNYSKANLTFPRHGRDLNRVLTCEDWDRDAADCVTGWTVNRTANMGAGSNASHLWFTVNSPGAYSVGVEVFERTVNETFNHSSIRNRTQSISKAFAQAVGISESPDDVRGFTRPLDLSVSYFRDVFRSFDGERLRNTAISIVDDVKQSADMARLLSQTLSVDMSTQGIFDLSRSVTSTYSYMAGTVRNLSGVRAVKSSPTFSVDTVRDVELFRDSNQGIGVFPSIDTGRFPDRIISRSIDLTETISRQVTMDRSLNEVYAYAGTVAGLESVAKLVSEDVSVTVSTFRTSMVGRALGQSIAVVSDVPRSIGVGRAIEASYGYADTVLRTLTNDRTLDETVGIATTIDRSGSLGRLVAANIDVAGSIVRTAATSRAVDGLYSVGGETGRTLVSYRKLTDDIILSRTVYTAETTLRSVTHSIDFSTSFTVASALGRTIDTSVSYTAGLVRGYTGGRTITGTIDYLAAESKQVAVEKIVTQSLSVTETVIESFRLRRGDTPRISVVTDIFREQDTGRSLSQDMSISLDAARSFSGDRMTSAVVGVNTAVERTRGLLRSTAATFSYGASVLHTYTGTREIVSSISLTLPPLRDAGMARSFSDTFSIGDAVSTSTTTLKRVTETFQLADAVSSQGLLGRTVTTTVTTLDSVSRQANLDRTISIIYDYTGTVTEELAVSAVIDEAFGLETSIDRDIDLGWILDESVSIDTAVRNTVSLARLQEDFYDVNSGLERHVGLGRSVASSVSIGDAVERTRGLARTVQQGLGMVSQTVRTGDVGRIIGESVSISTGISGDTILRKTVGQVVGYTEQVGRTLSIGRLIDGVYDYAAATGRSVAADRSVSLAISITDLLDFFIVSGDDGDGGGDDGGGGTGGGGGTLPPPEPEPVPGLDVLTDEIIVKLEPGASTTTDVTFTNNGTDNGSYIVEVRDLQQFFAPERVSRSLRPDTSTTVQFHVEAANGSAAGLYEGSVAVLLEEAVQIPATVIVEEVEEERVDVSIDLPDEIAPEDDTEIELEVFNTGSSEEVISTVSTIVRDANGSIVLRRNSSVSVDEAISISQNLREDLPEGNYTVKVVSRYGDEVTRSRSSFRVRDRSREAVEQGNRRSFLEGRRPIWIGLILLSLFAVLGLWARRRNEAVAADGYDFERSMQQGLRCSRCGHLNESRAGYYIHALGHRLAVLKGEVLAVTGVTDGSHLCGRCGATFRSQTGLELHQRRKHKR